MNGHTLGFCTWCQKVENFVSHNVSHSGNQRVKENKVPSKTVTLAALSGSKKLCPYLFHAVTIIL